MRSERFDFHGHDGDALAGRLDLPDASVERMFDSLARCARELSDDVVIYPGHAYNGESSTAAREKREGLLRPFTKTQWMAMHAR